MKIHPFFLKYVFLGFISILHISKASATHLVGGELAVTHIADDRYLLTLNVYFDKINGNPGALDQEAPIGIYRKSDDLLIDIFTIPLIQETAVPYSNPKCAGEVPTLQTSNPVYAAEIRLQGSRYDDPEGYYLSYDRCCRNNIIENIVNPQDTGQLFYLEIPPVVKNGAPFINSTPVLFPPLSDFACVGQPFYFDFSGSDPDGDSLVYSLSRPLAGFSNPDDPNPGPAAGAVTAGEPYPPVDFLPGYSVQNMVQGTPSLAIDNKGYLTLTPSEAGLYVFAVKCEEYRDGEKIGEVRRDFQMLVVQCPDNQPPVVTVSSPNPEIPPYVAGDTIRYELGLDTDPCFLLDIFDNNNQDTVDVRLEELTPNSLNDVTITPLNADGLTGVALGAGQSLRAELCLPNCSAIIDEIYQFQVIVGDRSCALPLLDTAVFTILIESQPNIPPTSELTIPDLDPSDECYSLDAVVGETLSFNLNSLDPDLDSLRLQLSSASLDLAAEGISFSTSEGDAEVTGEFRWTPTCDNLEPGQEDRLLEMFFVVEDYWKCGVKSTDTLCLNINLSYIPEPNEPPSLSTSGNEFTIGASQVLRDTVTLGENFTFDLSVLDVDGDNITLDVEGLGFSLAELGMAYSGSQSGVGSLNGTFTWNPTCESLRDLDNGVFNDSYQIQFTSTDINDCYLEEESSITVELVVLFEPDPNIRPNVSFEEVNEISFDPAIQSYCDTITVGEFYSLDFWAADADNNERVFLEAVPQGFSLEDLGILFENKDGTLNPNDTLRSQLVWQPSCESLDALNGQSFTIDIITRDVNTCSLSEADTVRLKLFVADIAQIELKAFPNAFSPNGDGIGDKFSINNLPVDNCADQFVGITIVNRWGVKVFESPDRDFIWEGESIPSGIYYYHIRYQNSDYQGTVSVFKGVD